MPPQSRGVRLGSHSISTPNLPALRGLPRLDTAGSDLPEDERPTAVTKETFPALDSGSERDDEPTTSEKRTSIPTSFQLSPDSSSSQDSEDDEDEDDTQVTTPNNLTNVKSNSTARVSPAPPRLSPIRPPPPKHSQSLYVQSNRSYSSYLSSPTSPPATHYTGPAAFAPPFYNRPPTPLPPSPSLTSLLRPSFSSLPSRPATPTRTPIDSSSDTEATGTAASTVSATGNGAATTAAAVGRAARTAPTSVPRASPKVPTYEYYGFVLYLGSSAVFFLFLLWSFLPTPFLHQLGIYYYPNRWWSLALPSWLVMGVIWIFVALASWNTGVLTLEVSALGCLVDEVANVAIVDSSGRIVRTKRGANVGRKGKRADTDKEARKASGREHKGKGKRKGRHGPAVEAPSELEWRNLWNEGTDAVMDVPIGGVCEVLYGQGRDISDGEISDEDLMPHGHGRDAAYLDAG